MLSSSDKSYVRQLWKTIFCSVVLITLVRRLIKRDFKIKVLKIYHKKLKAFSRVLRSSLRFFFFSVSFSVWYKLIVSWSTSILGEEEGAWLLAVLAADSGLAQFISISKQGVDVHFMNNLFFCYLRHQRSPSTMKYIIIILGHTFLLM